MNPRLAVLLVGILFSSNLCFAFSEKEADLVLRGLTAEMSKDVNHQNKIELKKMYDKIDLFGNEASGYFKTKLEKSTVPTERVVSLQWMKKNLKDDAYPFILKALDDTADDVRIVAINFIRDYKDHDWSPNVIGLLGKEKSKEMKIYALVALSKFIENPEVKKTIQAYVSDSDPDIKKIASKIINSVDSDAHAITCAEWLRKDQDQKEAILSEVIKHYYDESSVIIRKPAKAYLAIIESSLSQQPSLKTMLLYDFLKVVATANNDFVDLALPQKY